jgi:hypothetical protein
MSENTDTPIMNAAEGWHDRRDLLSQIGKLERQLAEANKQFVDERVQKILIIGDLDCIKGQLAEARVQSPQLHVEKHATMESVAAISGQAVEASQQRDRLAEALLAYRKAMEDGPENCSYTRYEIVDIKASDALSALNQPGEWREG